MPWYRLAFQASAVQDLASIDGATAQRLLEKTKWLASNIGNLRHEPITAELPGLCKYAVSEWRILYAIDREDQLVDIHAILHRHALRV